MKPFFYKFILQLILFAGVFIGIAKGQDARQKWVSRKKMKYEAKKSYPGKSSKGNSEIALDEIEMSTYHR